MRMYDIILKKRNGIALSKEEIDFFINGVTDGTIPDYQITALLMSIYYNGMTDDETLFLTKAMASSGDYMDLSVINGIKLDKHSTGGVGDKTTLIIAPIVSACGIPMAKMSGRGLGFTGGTIDKLESISGLNTNIQVNEFSDIVNKYGICIAGQSGCVVPADKKLYALRDVTATVDSIPLIASSIMSKKLAMGSDAILLDVKTGCGAFMKTLDDAIALAKAMVAIGEGAEKNTVALITAMDQPLGNAIGNSLEMIEAIELLKGNIFGDLYELCIELATIMLCQAGKGNTEECSLMARNTIKTGSALSKLKDMVFAQGGDISYLEDTNKFPTANSHIVKSRKSGYIKEMNAEKCGMTSVILGAGRETKDSTIDLYSGILLEKKSGDYVSEGEVLATFYTNRLERLQEAESIFLSGLSYSDEKPSEKPLVYAFVDKNGIRLTDFMIN